MRRRGDRHRAMHGTTTPKRDVADDAAGSVCDGHALNAAGLVSRPERRGRSGDAGRARRGATPRCRTARRRLTLDAHPRPCRLALPATDRAVGARSTGARRQRRSPPTPHLRAAAPLVPRVLAAVAAQPPTALAARDGCEPRRRSYTVTTYAVFVVTVFGVGAWLRFTSLPSASRRALATPRGDNALVDVRRLPRAVRRPVRGVVRQPLTWPARGPRGAGCARGRWTLVGLAGELGTICPWLTALSTSSLGPAWVVAAVCAIVWVARRSAPRGSRRSPTIMRRSVCASGSHPRRLASPPLDGHREGSVCRWRTNSGDPLADWSARGRATEGLDVSFHNEQGQGQRDRVPREDDVQAVRPRRQRPAAALGASTTAPLRGEARRGQPVPHRGRLLALGRLDPQVMRCFMVPAGLHDHRRRHRRHRRDDLRPRGRPRLDDLRDPVQQVPRRVRPNDPLRRDHHDRGRDVPLRRDDDRRALEERRPHLAHRPQHHAPNLARGLAVYEWSEEHLADRRGGAPVRRRRDPPVLDDLEFGDLPPYGILRKLFAHVRAWTSSRVRASSASSTESSPADAPTEAAGATALRG